MSNRAKAILMLLVSSVLWSSGGVLIKLVEWNPLAISGVRSLIAASVLALFMKPPRLGFSRAEVWGAVAYALTVLLFVMATKWTTAANAIFLQYTAPVYVALLSSWFLGERPKLRDWLCIAAILFGLGLFFIDGLTTGNWLGNGIALLSGMTMALMIVLMRHEKNETPLRAIFLGNLIAAGIGIPFAVGVTVTTGSVIGILLLGVFQLGLPYLLYSKAIKKVTALEASIIPAIEPVLNPLWVLLLVGEVPRPVALIGGGIVVGAAVVRSLGNNK